MFVEGLGILPVIVKIQRIGSRSTLMPSNKFEVLKRKLMNVEKESGGEIRKNKKIILRERKRNQWRYER